MSCPESPSGNHEPVEIEADLSDDENTILSFICVHCGVSGTMEVNLEDAAWEVFEEDEDDF